MIVPTKHRGIHSDLFESLEKSCFFSTNLQFPLFFRIFAIARGAWWRSSFLAPASERGLFLPSVIVIRSEWSCKMAFFSFSSGPNDLSTVALLHSRLGLVTRKNHDFCFFKPQKGQYYTFHVRPSVSLFHNLCMLNAIGPFPPLANGLHSLAIRRRGVFSYRIYTPKNKHLSVGKYQQIIRVSGQCKEMAKSFYIWPLRRCLSQTFRAILKKQKGK